jgi:hypothetical protein
MKCITKGIVDNFKIVISSHIRSYQTIAPLFIESLIRAGLSTEKIILVIGGNDSKSNSSFLDCKAIFVDHNSYDHTGLIEVLESNHESDYWFSTHDTCIAGSEFVRFLNQYTPKKDYVSMTDMGWLNMGLFKKSYLERNKDYIISLKNCSKIRAILSERVFTRLEDFDYFVPDYNCIRTLENENIYKDDKKRNVLYFKGIDFYKYQSYEALNIMKPNYSDGVVDLI